MTRQEYFKLFHVIGIAYYDLLTENLRNKTFRKGEFIPVPGQIQREVLFVKSGVQMSYFDAENKTHVITFTYPTNFSKLFNKVKF